MSRCRARVQPRRNPPAGQRPTGTWPRGRGLLPLRAPTQRVDAQRRRCVAQLRRHREGGRVEVHRDPAGHGHVPQVSQQPVAHVAHRGGAGEGGQAGRARTAAPDADAPRPGLRGIRNPRCSTASPPAAQPRRPATATTSPGRAPARVTGSRPCRSPSAVTAMTTESERDDVPTDHTRTHQRRLLAQPVGQLEGPRDGQVRGRTQPDQERGRHGPPSLRCPPGSARPPCARCRWPRTSPGGSGVPRQGRRSWPPPGRRGPRSPQRRRPVRGAPRCPEPGGR